MLMNDCLFCSIISGEIPASVRAETENVLAFDDVNPVAPTHVLVIPKRHIESAAQIERADDELLGELFGVAAGIGMEINGGWRLVSNVGENAGQSVFHLHFHVLGGRTMDWPPG
ncbi:MAG: histidine triad nucleotide-binding protein [Acidimicrobiia bacterium]